MLDAAGLELTAQSLRHHVGDGVVVDTRYAHEQGMIEVRPDAVREVLRFLKQESDAPFDMLASLHGCDYYPEEPRLAVHYQLLSTARRERLGLKTRVTVEEPEVPSVIDVFGTADLQEREIYDFFGVVFEGHPDLRRTHLPEDYEGHPQRRDFPIGGEPVLFTFNEKETPRWYE